MITLKKIKLKTKVMNRDQIVLLFDLQSSCPCLYPLLYSLKILRFQSLSTQESDLIALKFWYQFWFEKYSTSFCESFYSTSYNFEIIQNEIDNFIIFLENDKKIENKLIFLRVDESVNYKLVAGRVRSFLKFYTFLIDEYLQVHYQNQISVPEIQKIKNNLNKYISLKKKIINKFSGYSKSKFSYNFKSMNNDMIQDLYSIIKPNKAKSNNLNPFTSMHAQLRNFLIIHILLNYGLRIGELMLLTIDSIKKSMYNNRAE